MTTPPSSDRSPPDPLPVGELASDPALARTTIAPGFEARVQHQPIDIQSEIMSITHNPNVGAIVNFLGVVRRRDDGDDVVALELEHYPGMTEQSFGGIVEEAIARWRLEAVKIVHRVGRIAPGDTVVLVVVAAPHRGAAFEACEFMMDLLKAHAPLWKKEILRDGTLRWVEATTHDERSMLRWG